MIKVLIIIVVLISGLIFSDKKFNLQKKIYTVTNSQNVKGEYKTIPLKEVKELIDSKQATILDVRNPNELESDGYIAGSKNIPLGELETRMNELDKNKKYITFCAVGGRSQKAAALLTQKGFKNILNAEDGMKNWPYEKVKK